MKNKAGSIFSLNSNFYEELYSDPFASKSYEVRNADRVLKMSGFLTEQLNGKRVLDVGRTHPSLSVSFRGSYC